MVISPILLYIFRLVFYKSFKINGELKNEFIFNKKWFMSKM